MFVQSKIISNLRELHIILSYIATTSKETINIEVNPKIVVVGRMYANGTKRRIC